MRACYSRLADVALSIVLVAALAGGALGPTDVGSIRAAAQAGPMDEVRQQERAAAAALEQSSAAVQAAGVELARVAAALPRAQQEAAEARGALAGATAKARAAELRAAEAERALQSAQAAVRAASARVEAGRREAGALARGVYQRGSLQALQAVLDAKDPQQALRRSSMLRSVFQHREATLDRLTSSRLALASTSASMAADRRAADRARQEAVREKNRAEQLASAADEAARGVAALLSDRQAALGTAERLREQDRRDYVRAQAESRALAERIRAAAAAAKARAKAEADRAAAEARRRAAAGAAPKNPSRPSRSRSSDMAWPADGPLTSRYGYRTHPIYGDRRMHTGIDIGAGAGVPIIASDDGTVLLSEYSGGYGNLTVVEHASRAGRSVTTSYAHQSVMYVQPGQQVRRGQMIGRAGDTGNVTGPHLHFEVRLDGDPVDPMNYVER